MVGPLLPRTPRQLCRAIWAIWGGKGPWAEGPSQPILAGELGQASVSPSVNKGVMMAVCLGDCELVARAGLSQSGELCKRILETPMEHPPRALP